MPTRAKKIPSGGFSPRRGIHTELEAMSTLDMHPSKRVYTRRGHAKDQEFGDRVERRRRELRLTHRELTQRLRNAGDDIGESATRQYVGKNASRPREEGRLMYLAQALETSVEYLITGMAPAPTKIVPPDPKELGYVLVSELEFPDKGKERRVHTWGLSFDYLQQDARIANTDNLAIVKIEAAAGALEYGDRVLVDRSLTRPSPAGYFLHWDGVGHAINYIEVRPSGAKPIARVSKDPQGTDMYEIPADKLHIVGRLKARWHAL